jgi:hypothetical protein
VKELATSYEERNEGPLDFTQFRDKPLVRIDKAYFPIDMRFLVEKLEGGVFWKVNALLDHHSRSSLHSAWGKGFESYSNWLLRESTDGHINGLLESPKYIETGNQVTDAIVLCGDKAVFVECKTAMMRSETKYGGKADRLAEEMYRKFVESNERPQGVKQLALAINTVFNKDTHRSVKGLDVGAIRKVYPLILTKDSIGGSIGLSKYLRKFFKPEIKVNSLTAHVMPLFCLSIDQFEEIAEVLEKNSFSDLLYGWWRNDRTLGSNFPLASGTGTRTQSRRLPEALMGAMYGLFDETMKYFPEFEDSEWARAREGDDYITPAS